MLNLQEPWGGENTQERHLTPREGCTEEGSLLVKKPAPACDSVCRGQQ